MPEPRRTPWIAIDVDIRKDDRIADLPSDAARWGYVAGVLAESRLQDPRGVFGSKATFEEAVGRFARHLDQYLAVGLMERSPKLCDGCRERFGDLKNGALVVHNWHRKQADPTHAERQRRHRLKNGKGRQGDGDGDGEVTDNGVTITSHRDGPTRARAETPDTDTRHVTPKEAPVVPRVTPREARAPGTSSAAQSDEPIQLPRPDVAALRQRGWTRLTEQQLASLDEVADFERASEYDVESGQRVVAGWILSAPRGAELLSHVFATSRRVRDQRQVEADQRTEQHERHKQARLHPSLGGVT